MPERVSKEERIVSLAIEKARKAKEELSAKQRKNIEPTQVLEIDTDPEVEKIKRPKVQDASKITNQTQKKEGYGLAGESLKKAKFQGPPRQLMTGKTHNTMVNMKMKDALRAIELQLRGAENDNKKILKDKIKRIQEKIDEIDELLLDAAKYGKGDPDFDVIDRTDSKFLPIAGAKYDTTRSFE